MALSAVDEAFGIDADGSFFAYPSYVNRVYGFKGQAPEHDGSQDFVVKFYRPGRWSSATIQEEHQFLRELAAVEVPVVPPLPGPDGATLQELSLEDDNGETIIPFALYPKHGGRSFDADGLADMERIGALAGRIHLVGASSGSQHRLVMGPGSIARYTAELLASGAVHPEAEAALTRLLDDASVVSDASFTTSSPGIIRLHGDFHRGNVLDRVGEGLLAMDFDDMCMGPAVQDLWMLLPGTVEDSPSELAAAIDGYERFRAFDTAELALIEPLRLIRMIHYLVWQVRQCHDRGFQVHFPGWGSRGFWFQELDDLRMQLDRIDGLAAIQS
jgi:Ser/Thr protein kinase RdoA (MazF antagonist)